MYYKVADTQKLITAKTYAIVNNFSSCVSNKALGETIKELQKTFTNVVVLLQLPVSAKFAEGQFKVMECVR